MNKIAILSTKTILGFFEPDHPLAKDGHNLHEKGASAGDLTHFTLDYQDLTQALARQGLSHDLVAWNDKTIDWSDYSAVLIHTPWDYYEHKSAFLETLQKIESQTVLLNSFKTVQWNIDKKYLQDAKRYGLSVIDTVFVEPDQVQDVLEVIPDAFWEKGCVFKPSVSAGAMDVYLIKDKNEAEKIYTAHFKNKHETLMIQPFMEEIKQEGEWSFVFFNGIYSHGVLKKTLEDGFGVKHSTKNKNYVPTPEMVNQAKEMFNLLEKARQDKPLYTRLDTIKRADGKLYIMEIEQIEPFLYLHAREGAAEDLVRGIVRVTAEA